MRRPFRTPGRRTPDRALGHEPRAPFRTSPGPWTYRTAMGISEDVSTFAYEVYAVKYAERDGHRGEHFLGGDPHEDEPMPMDYFVWAVVGGGRAWVVDTGFGQHDADARGRRLLRSAADGLALIGVNADHASDVIITHLHYDHVGGFDQFPRARFHVQDREVAYATGRHM